MSESQDFDLVIKAIRKQNLDSLNMYMQSSFNRNTGENLIVKA